MALLAMTYLLYLQSVRQKKMLIARLDQRIEALEGEKGIALRRQDELKLQVASQGDPAWVEMVLMRELGMVPEGQRKVYFKR